MYGDLNLANVVASAMMSGKFSSGYRVEHERDDLGNDWRFN